KVHGGAMLALCANAARTACGGQSGGLEPVAVSASFLWAPDPGVMQLVTSIRKRGRRISVVDVELMQGDRTAVHAVVNLGEPEHFPPGGRAAPLLSANPVLDLMTPDPPGDVQPIGPGHPLAGLVHLGEGCDVRPLRRRGGARPVGGRRGRGWGAARRGCARDALFALMGGVFRARVPSPAARPGWAPRVHLTPFRPALPADGWLRVVCTCLEIG